MRQWPSRRGGIAGDDHRTAGALAHDLRVAPVDLLTPHIDLLRRIAWYDLVALLDPCHADVNVRIQVDGVVEDLSHALPAVGVVQQVEALHQHDAVFLTIKAHTARYWVSHRMVEGRELQLGRPVGRADLVEALPERRRVEGVGRAAAVDGLRGVRPCPQGLEGQVESVHGHHEALLPQHPGQGRRRRSLARARHASQGHKQRPTSRQSIGLLLDHRGHARLPRQPVPLVATAQEVDDGLHEGS
mmetsp:Transcript_59707/g.192139  ORF Transcript_59707/g.192139 Transcript_59707/m.192139 type:complete len:244 (+) Transcript_59707:130-861(+)